MKRVIMQGVAALACAVIATNAQAQNATRNIVRDERALADYASASVTLPEGTRVAEVGANHRRLRVPTEPDWEQINALPADQRDEMIAAQSFSDYTELASGLNFYVADVNGGQGTWRESVAEFRVFENAFVADKGQTKVILKRRLTGEGDVDILASGDGTDEVRLVTEIVGLVYHDRETGESLLVAEPRETEGFLLPPNQVIYPDAFDGDISADIRYLYNAGSWHQDIIVREIVDPAALDMPPAVEIQVWTSMSPSREPVKTARVIDEVAGIVDEDLDFGTIRFVAGRAFSLAAADGNAAGRRGDSAPAAKTWLPIEGDPGRSVLIESVEYAEIKDAIEALPRKQAEASGQPKTSRTRLLASLSSGRERESASQAVAWRQGIGEIVTPEERPLIAAADLTARPGYVLDYSSRSGSAGNATFRGDETYYISSDYSISGTLTLEGGAVVKYNTGTDITIESSTGLALETAMYRPVTFTSKYDGTIGEYVATGTAAAGDYDYALRFEAETGTYNLENVRFRFADVALLAEGTSPVNHFNITHAQFVSCDTILEHEGEGDVTLHNVLIDEFDEIILDSGSDIDLVGVNLTVNGGDQLFYPTASNDVSVILTNSLITSVTTTTGIDTSVETVVNPGGTVYQTVGAGDFYLAEGSAYRNAGTAAIDAGLLADLQNRTTYPPILPGGSEGSHTLSGDTVWAPQIARDDDGAVDLGYHFAPIDFAVNYLNIPTGAELTIRNGTAIAQYGLYGIRTTYASHLKFQGTADSRVQYFRFESVQEQPERWGGGSETSNSTYIMISGGGASGAGRSVDLRFADIHLGESLNQYSIHFNANSGHINDVILRDCRVYNGCLHIGGYTTDDVDIVNNLFIGGRFDLHGKSDMDFYNNLFHDQYEFQFNQTSGSVDWQFHDNLFYDTYLSLTSVYFVVHDHNAYKDVNVTDIGGYYGGTNNVVEPTLSFEGGAFGGWYQTSSTDLDNVGSRTASAAGLAQFTVFDGADNSDTGTVDIGFHHVTVNSDDLPLDHASNGIPGVPDYIEDVNGDGTLGMGEFGMTDGLDFSVTVDGVTNLVNFLIGNVGSASAYSASGQSISIGSYTNAVSSGLPDEFDHGILLSTGHVTNAVWFNWVYESPDFEADPDTAHAPNHTDSDIDALLDVLESDPELEEYDLNLASIDAASISFTFTPSDDGTLQFDYIFASEEYPDFIDEESSSNPLLFNIDIMAIFVGPNNVAVVGANNDPVSVFTVNEERNCEYFQPNYADPGSHFLLPYDGFTSNYEHPWLGTEPVTVENGVSVNVKIVISDENDKGFDSVVFLRPVLSLD